MEKQEELKTIINEYKNIYTGYALIINALQGNNKIVNRRTIQCLDTLRYTIENTGYSVSPIIVDKTLILSVIPDSYRNLPDLLRYHLEPKERWNTVLPQIISRQTWCAEHIKALQHDLQVAEQVKTELEKLNVQRRTLAASLCAETRDIFNIH